MRLQDVAYYALNSLAHRRMRTFLTLLGIVVGISSVIILVGLVQGLKQDILEQLESFGPRTIIVTPTSTSSGTGFGGAAFAPTSGKLFEKDFERIKRLPGIRTITKVLSGSTSVEYKETIINSQVWGVDPDVFTDTLDLKVTSGRFLAPSDSGVAVVGSRVSESFDEDIRTQSTILIDGRRFKVVGVLQPTGSSFGPVDNVIFVPFDDARPLFADHLLDKEISAIRLTLEEGTDVDESAERIEDIMRSSHRVAEGEEDFGVISPTFINNQFNNILDTLSIFLGAIASISLIVGGIGISNTMFMSVLERTREIGTMKAVGATQRQIRDMFLAESCMLGLGGGLAGLVLAIMVGILVRFALGVSFAFDPMVMAGAVAFSVIIGGISGTVPAINAARVDPIIALRYE